MKRWGRVSCMLGVGRVSSLRIFHSSVPKVLSGNRPEKSIVDCGNPPRYRQGEGHQSFYADCPLPAITDFRNVVFQSVISWFPSKVIMMSRYDELREYDEFGFIFLKK